MNCRVGLAIGLLVPAIGGCASAPKVKPIAGDRPAVISAAPGDAFVWRGHSYDPDRMANAIRAAKASEGITSVVLAYDQEATVQDIIDTAMIARGASLPAFYEQGGKLNHIEVSR